jgi:capsular exopolysaccharide synthesis family protein
MNTVDRLRNDWLLATEISKLESRIWRAAQRDDLCTIMMTSAVRGEGKSTTVAYLATAMGLYPDRKILAIDFDFRIPTLNSHFGLKVPFGVDRVLSGEVDLFKAVIRTELDGLHVLLPNAKGADPHLLHRTEKIAALIQSLRDRYDLILIDSPAILPVPDSTMLMPFADAVVLAGMSGWSTEPQMKRAMQIIAGLDANLLGLVVGDMQEAAPEYFAGDYHYYGYANAPSRGERGGA